MNKENLKEWQKQAIRDFYYYEFFRQQQTNNWEFYIQNTVWWQQLVRKINRVFYLEYEIWSIKDWNLIKLENQLRSIDN